MKFVIFDLTVGRIRDANVYFSVYLKNHGCVQVTEKPENEFYLVVGLIQLMRWADNAHRYKNSPILDDIRNKKAGFILTTDMDSFGLGSAYQRERLSEGYYHNIVKYNIVENIKHGCKQLDVDPQSVIYTDTNYKIETVFKKFNLSAMWANIYVGLMEPTDTSNIIENIKNKKDREKKFLYLGGKGRLHRLVFVNELLKIPNFKEDCFLSTGGGHFPDFYTKETKYIDNIVLDLEEIRYLPEHLCLSYTNHHARSYINIIPMSYFYMDHSHLEVNEKNYKPMINMQPFIMLGQPGSLKVMRELGYKTFDTWIDESYDMTLNDNERFVKVLNEVKRFNTMSKSELNDMLLDMLPTLEYNENLYRTRYYEKDYTMMDKILNKFNQTR